SLLHQRRFNDPVATVQRQLHDPDRIEPVLDDVDVVPGERGAVDAREWKAFWRLEPAHFARPEIEHREAQRVVRNEELSAVHGGRLWRGEVVRELLETLGSDPVHAAAETVGGV